MLSSGTERWPEAQLRALLRDKGGDCDGWTGYDAAGVPQRRLTLALEWLAQLVFHPTFPEYKLAKERQAIASERVLYDPQLLRILRHLRLTVTFDHDIIDGGPAARFTQRLAELIQAGAGLTDAL